MTAPSGVAAENPWAGQGSVLLDIGGEVGALVVEMPGAMEGVEVEARRTAQMTDRHVHHPHVAVVNRPVEGGVQPSLVFPELVEGDYWLALKGAADGHLVAVVRGGEVTTVTW